jgi:hypothetical protein
LSAPRPESQQRLEGTNPPITTATLVAASWTADWFGEVYVTVLPVLQAQYISCNLCGGNDYGVLFPAGQAQSHQIVRCLGCGLMYANPRTGEIDFVRVANSDPDFLNEMLQRSYDPRMEKERCQVKDYETTRDILADLFPARGNLLEVGSGLGFYFTSLRKTAGSLPAENPTLYAASTQGPY